MLKGYFPLPKSSWIENYYTPLENIFDGFIAKYYSLMMHELSLRLKKLRLPFIENIIIITAMTFILPRKFDFANFLLFLWLFKCVLFYQIGNFWLNYAKVSFNNKLGLRIFSCDGEAVTGFSKQA